MLSDIDRIISVPTERPTPARLTGSRMHPPPYGQESELAHRAKVALGSCAFPPRHGAHCGAGRPDRRERRSRACCRDVRPRQRGRPADDHDEEAPGRGHGSLPTGAKEQIAGRMARRTKASLQRSSTSARPARPRVRSGGVWVVNLFTTASAAAHILLRSFQKCSGVTQHAGGDARPGAGGLVLSLGTGADQPDAGREIPLKPRACRAFWHARGKYGSRQEVEGPNPGVFSLGRGLLCFPGGNALETLPVDMPARRSS